MRLDVLAVAVALGLSGGTGVGPARSDTENVTDPAAQSGVGMVTQLIEMPAHRALAEVRKTPGVTLAPFETDGCSGGLSEVWRLVADQFPGFAEAHKTAPPWEQCCVTHDVAYHAGGASAEPRDSMEARLRADEALQTCVRDSADERRGELAALYDMTDAQITAGYDTIAGAMFLAVRFGGAPCSGLPWRWGYGYPGCSVLSLPLD